jgi:D-glycero-D-manno-heptose 1,7-bisphosphate phosphatase
VPRPAVFLDRDGTIIEDVDYLGSPIGVRLLPGAGRAIARLTDADLPVVIVTNQSGIGRGYYTEAEFAAVQSRLEELIRDAGGQVLATYHCPHSPDQFPPCDCRKPAGGLFLKASREHDLDLARSAYIGDRMRDLEAGLARGGTGYLIDPHPAGIGQVTARLHRVGSLEEAVAQLLDSDSTRGSD